MEDLCEQLEVPERPIFRTEYSQGIADGATDTQILIAKKLRYAIEQEKNNRKDYNLYNNLDT